MWLSVAASIAHATGRSFSVATARDLPCGMSAAAVIEGGGQRYFVKHHTRSRLPMFEAEAAGLRELAATQTMRVPAVICTGVADERAYLVLEYLGLIRADDKGDARLGEALAALHRRPQQFFGWWRDNTIGTTPQTNSRSLDWATFFRDCRLRPQLALAAANGYKQLAAPGQRLLEYIEPLLAGHRPAPALLHGDLWSGNRAVMTDGAPVVFDPACYYGDPETDLAMT